MKKQLLLFALGMGSLGCGHAWAQAEDVDEPLLRYVDQNHGIKFSAGARLFADVAYYHTEYAPMKSGAAITDARFRTSLEYKDFYFYADFDFSKGSFKQKNIFVRWNFIENYRGIQSLKAGYFNEPSTMANNTSLYNYHFISRPAVVVALAPKRSLGIAYKFFNQNLLAEQGIFAENKYNDQLSGFQGISLSGRWLYKAIRNPEMTLHAGLGLRYARINTGWVVDDDAFETSATMESPMETYVDATARFLHADVPWARNILGVTPECLFVTNRLFARGEYLYKRLYKNRPDFELFTNQLGSVWSWTTLESWKEGNPIRSTKFDGGYVEAGFLILGNKYFYNDEYGLLEGINDKNSLEVVARYSIVNLNDINKGDFFLIGKQIFYPEGVIADYPATSTSVGGGKMQAITIGANYTLNQYVKVMGEYKYSRLDNVYYPMDKNFHELQLRLMVSF